MKEKYHSESLQEDPQLYTTNGKSSTRQEFKTTRTKDFPETVADSRRKHVHKFSEKPPPELSNKMSALFMSDDCCIHTRNIWLMEPATKHH